MNRHKKATEIAVKIADATRIDLGRARVIADQLIDRQNIGFTKLKSFRNADLEKEVMSMLQEPLQEQKMKITKETLKQIINEERERLLNESEQGEYSTEPNYGKGGNAAGPSHHKSGGFGDVAKQPDKPRYTGANAAAAIMSILKNNGVSGSFEDLNAIAYQIIKSGVVQKITHPND